QLRFFPKPRPSRDVRFRSNPSMPTFQYRAIQPDGKVAEGQLEAAGRPDAFRQMEGRGLRPVSLAERAAAKNGAAKAVAAPAGDNFSFNFKSQKVSAKELENFTR